jgi:hypothetical protein
VSIDEVISSSSLPEILDEEDRVPGAMGAGFEVGFDVSGSWHNPEVSAVDGKPEDMVLTRSIRDLDWRSPNDSAAALPINARQRIQIPGMCGVYFIILHSIQMPVYILV